MPQKTMKDKIADLRVKLRKLAAEAEQAKQPQIAKALDDAVASLKACEEGAAQN